MENINASKGREDGQMLILFVLALGVLMGFMAMSIDVGMIFVERRSLQNAADAAALAGAPELPPTGNSAAAKAKAEEFAAKNGFVDGVDGVTVKVQTPHNGDEKTIQVTITKDEPFIFARALGLDAVEVSADAAATLNTATAGGDFAILVLNETGCSAFDKSGSNDITIDNNGAIMVNSDCTGSNAGLNKTGGGDLTADGGIFHYSGGGWSQSGSGLMIPEPAPLSYRVPDPLVGLTPPSLYGDPDPTSPDSGGTAAAPDIKEVNSGNHTFRPGVYWGGIAIKASANAAFEPGTYIMAGGGFALTGNGATTGNGVFFYNTFDPENLANKYDGNCKPFNLRGSADFTFTAPTSGPYTNILFWQDEACDDAFKFEGSGVGISGVAYTPSARFDLAGSGDLGALQIITDTIDITGSGDMIIEFIPFIEFPPTAGAVRLVE